jgi:ADP-ribose pyrophosphatase
MVTPTISIAKRSTVLETPYFRLVARHLVGQQGDPYYAIETSDYVSIVAIAEGGSLLLVRQFRPAVEDWSLELPAGHVDPGEEPQQAARRELLEETGHEASELKLLGCLRPDTGRLSNRMWCYFAANARRKTHAIAEAGVTLVEVPRGQWASHLSPPKFCHALHVAAIQLALAQGCLTLDDLR